VFSVVFIFSFLIIFFRLGMNHLVPYDEGIYAQVAKEMVIRGDWITQYHNGLPWFEKPPLQTWVTASLFLLFRVDEFWARAASALSGLFLVLITYYIGVKYICIRVGLLSAVILLSSYLFLWIARQGFMDMMLSLFIYLTLAAFLFTNREARSWYIFWAAFSLGFMVKFWAAGVILIAVVIVLLVMRQVRQTLANKHFRRGILLSAVLILPWHLAMLYLHGSNFVERYVIYDLVMRTTTGLEQNVGPAFYYYEQLQQRLYPWYLLIPFAFVVNLYERKKAQRSPEPLILYILIIVVFAIYSFMVQTKLPWYITPIYPALSILISLLFVRAFDSNRTAAFWGLLYASFIALLNSTTIISLVWVIFSTAVLLGLHLLICALKNSPDIKWEMNEQRSPPNNRYRLMSALLATPEKELVRKVAVVLMLLLFIGVGFRHSLRVYGEQHSPSAVISKAAGEMNPNEELIVVCFSETDAPCVYEPVVLFYSSRPTRIAWSEQELFDITKHQGRQDIILASELLEPLSSAYDFEVIEVVPPFAYATIQRKLLP
jgi:4-amino-4-deoxy-L-arabinose transferase-like glycosyltransferase